MYFSFRRILSMVLVCHFSFPAPVRIPSASGAVPVEIRVVENGVGLVVRVNPL